MLFCAEISQELYKTRKAEINNDLAHICTNHKGKYEGI